MKQWYRAEIRWLPPEQGGLREIYGPYVKFLGAVDDLPPALAGLREMHIVCICGEATTSWVAYVAFMFGGPQLPNGTNFQLLGDRFQLLGRGAILGPSPAPPKIVGIPLFWAKVGFRDNTAPPPIEGRIYQAPANVDIAGTYEMDVLCLKQCEDDEMEGAQLWYVRVNFVRLDAPHHYMREGVRFRLGDGPRPFGLGRVLRQAPGLK